MNIRKATLAVFSIAVFAGTSSAALAQAPPPAPRVAATPSIPVDRKAYLDALKLSDPQKKVDALEKFVVDFPESFLLSSAYQQILTALAKSFPDPQERIMSVAKKTVASAQEPLKGSAYSTVVSILLDNGVMLDKAEDFAREGLAWTEEDQAKRLKLARAPYFASLGRVNLKRGKTKEAEKYLKDAITANPQLLDAMLGLAELAEKKNDSATALNYYASASLTGRMKPDAREKFYEFYRKSHEGTLKGIEELLDVRYRKDFPNPVKVEHYTATAARSERLVLAEVFTGAGCGPCVAADLAFDAYLERYPRKDLAVIMYHLHIPLPDPMTNASTEARAKYYAVNGVPSYAIDGEKSSGGGSREMTKDFYNRTSPTVEKRLTVAPNARIALDATSDTALVKVKAIVDQVKAGPKVRLQVALVEEVLRYSGENGVRFHPMVVRSLGGTDAGGFPVDAAKPTSVEVTFDLAKITQELKAQLDQFEEKRKDDKFQFSSKKHEIDPNALSVIAFVQDDGSQQILQAVSIKLKPAIASAAK
jgi:tetratricopeptide (TPR) repeat protein